MTLLVVALAAIDTGLSIYGLGHGFTELMPLAAAAYAAIGPLGLVAAKAAVVGAMLLMLARWPMSSIVRQFAWLLVVSMAAYPIAHNLAVLLSR